MNFRQHNILIRAFTLPCVIVLFSLSSQAEPWKRHTIDPSSKETQTRGADGVRLADANGDGHTDGLDLNILALNWQQTVTGGIADADFNEDGIVYVTDLNEIGTNWQTWRDGMPAAVPEPSTFVLLAITTVCVLAYGWRRKRKMAA